MSGKMDEFLDYLYHKKIYDTQNRFIKAKTRVTSFLSFYRRKRMNFLSDNTIANIKDCGSWLIFRNYYRKCEIKFHSTNYCRKDKLCSACAARRAFKQIQKIDTYLEENPKLKNKHWYFIVLPVKHDKSESFEIVFERLRTAMQNMRTRIKTNKRTKKKSFFSKFEGMFYSYEITKSKNGWNCHVNLLCMSDEHIDTLNNRNEDLMNEWIHYTDNDSYINFIKKIDMSEVDSKRNLFEVFKYIMKFQDLKNEDLATVYQYTHKKRMLGGLGCFYGIKIEEVELSETDRDLDDYFIQMSYLYNQKEKNTTFFKKFTLNPKLVHFYIYN